MEYLFSQKEKPQNILSDKFILLLLDYDGTLTPIAESPAIATLSKENKDLLKRLSKNTNCSLAIISGRSLEDIKSTIGLRGVIYAGNHGLEIEGPKIKFESQVSLRLKSVIHNIAEELPKRLAGIKGVLIEDKGLTLSIHYRLVDKEDLPAFEKIISEVTSLYTVRDKIKVNSGKKVYEIKPPVQWDKGKVVLWLMARQQFISGAKKVLPVYIGDDITDEDAFNALKRKGLTVFVGEPGNSKADYYLKNTEEVTKFLRLIMDLKPI
ncbi:MAG: trehalose-phosphatase [Candidatus Omnitrophota bacterium]